MPTRWRRSHRAPLRSRNVRPPLVLDVLAPRWPRSLGRFDAVFCANMLHIAEWATCAALMVGAARHLSPGGALVLYGPYLVDGEPTAPSNVAFDADLRQRNAAWGLRRLGDVIAEAERVGLAFERRVDMPANDLMLVFRRELERRAATSGVAPEAGSSRLDGRGVHAAIVFAHLGATPRLPRALTARRFRRRDGFSSGFAAPISRQSPTPDLAMARAFLLIRLTLVLVGGLARRQRPPPAAPPVTRRRSRATRSPWSPLPRAPALASARPRPGRAWHRSRSSAIRTTCRSCRTRARCAPVARSPCGAGRSRARHDEGIPSGERHGDFARSAADRRARARCVAGRARRRHDGARRARRAAGHEPVEPPRA